MDVDAPSPRVAPAPAVESKEGDLLKAEHLIMQGAEAKVYNIRYLGRACVVKERFAKKYRHPELDSRLRTRRTMGEVRCMTRCRKLGLDTPVLYLVDKDRHRIFMEFIVGCTVRDHLRTLDLASPQCWPQALLLAAQIGQALAKMHGGDIIHGDLTTSNLMLRQPEGALVIVDFGLSYSSRLVEDKAVDLYVLERAFLSTHPHSEKMFEEILTAYSKAKFAHKVLERLVEVRARGRKKDMVG